MKTGLILTSFLATGGTAGASATIGYVGGTLKTQDLNANKQTTQEISPKNIPDISKISELKEQNKIKDLVRESIPNTENPKSTTLNTHYSAKISVNDVPTKSNIELVTQRLNSLETDLGELLKEKIRLDKEKTTYDKVKAHIMGTPPTKAKWQITKDAAITSGCKLEKLPITPAVPTAEKCYDWEIILMDPKEKIKSLLKDQNQLLTEFNVNVPATKP